MKTKLMQHFLVIWNSGESAEVVSSTRYSALCHGSIIGVWRNLEELSWMCLGHCKEVWDNRQ